MDTKLQARRDEWLGLTKEEYGGVDKIYGTYLRTQIGRYAEYKLAQTRQKELDIQKDKRLSKSVDILIKIALAILGVTVFTILPNVLAQESGQTDSVASISKSVGGVILVFLGHWTISLLIKDILLNIQFKAYCKRIEDSIKNSNQALELDFLSAQLKSLKDTEEALCKSPSIFLIIFSLIASLAEVGGVIYLFTQDRSGESVNYFLLFIVAIVPLFILWAMSFVSAYYESVPKTFLILLNTYFSTILDIEDKFKKEYMDNENSNSSPEYFLKKMQGMFVDEIEKKEFLINYLLSRTRLADDRSNELILLEGEIDYYRHLKVLLEAENSGRKRSITSLHDEEMKTYRYEEDIEPTGQGGIPFQAKRSETRKLSELEKRLKRDDEMALSILDQCSRKIEELQQKHQKNEG